MWLDLYEEIADFYKWSLSAYVPLSLFVEIAEVYDKVRRYTYYYLRSGIRNSL